MRRLRIQFRWYDLWVGVFIGPTDIFVCPIPCVALRWRRKKWRGK